MANSVDPDHSAENGKQCRPSSDLLRMTVDLNRDQNNVELDQIAENDCVELDQIAENGKWCRP